tara:strand:+ start:1365 stop:2123 length:759 start_codon:yes stop_codon:yes gene_type:complete
MSNKIALITGASRGLGKEMALNLAKDGVHILFTYHKNESKANEIISEIESLGSKAKAFQFDAANPMSGKNLVKEITTFLQKQYENPNFDFLINNAGTGLNKPIEETTPSDFDDMVNIHLKSVFFLTQSALPYLNYGGRIVNISSGLTRFSFPGSSAYAMMKGGVEVFTRYLAKELGSRKITANVIAPGAIATDFGGGSNRDNEEKRTIISNITALGRVGEPEDIGGTVAFLCSEKAAWINGQRIELSGGMLI